MPGLRTLPWRFPLIFGVPACALAWAVFLATGGVAGDRGELPAALAFLIGAVGSGWAGFAAGRAGADLSRASLTGLLTGGLQALLYGFPHSGLLLLNRGYMKWIQQLPHAEVGRFGINVGYLHRLVQLGAGGLPPLPGWGLRLLAAFAGALLAGALLGAATGSIGGSLEKSVPELR